MNMYIKAETIIQNRHDRANQEAYARLQKLLKIPAFKTLYQEQQSYIISIAKKQYAGENSNEEEKGLKDVLKRQQDVLKNLGYDLTDLEPLYSCPNCHDTGKTDTGRCQCFYQIVSQILVEESGIKDKKLPSFKTTKFDIFEKEYQEDVKNLYKTAQKFIEKLHETKKELFVVCGMTGTGKTYLSECMIQLAIEKYIPTYYVTAFQMNNEMLNYHCSKLEDKQDIMDKYLHCDLLVIDDLGTEPILKNVTLEYLYLIINDRVNNNKKTVITTNLFPEELLTRYEERVFSRITNQKDAIFVEMKANNLRHSK